MVRLDSYSSSIREEQKAILNGLLGILFGDGIIYDNYDTTRRIQQTVDGIYRMVFTLLLIIIALIIVAILLICFFHCKRNHTDGMSPLHQSSNRKNHPIEI